MSLINAPSPHTRERTDTGAVMRRVILATLPGLAVLVWQFGAGVLFNVLWAAAVALACEALFLRARGKPVGFYLRDGSALVTAVLLGLALPPTAPWWLPLIGVAFAIVVAKQLYGGLGMNPFNPAMVGYVLLLISFPVAMTQWIAPGQAPAPADSLALFLGQTPADAFSGATPLDTFRTWAGDAGALAEHGILQGVLAGRGWQWVNLAFLVGGLYLLARRVIGWHIPVAFLAGLGVPALIAHQIDAARFAGPLFHLFSGGAMLGAFFIATDPVSAATSRLGRFIQALLIGVLIWVIRTFGGYPDAVAFAVLLLNLAAPFIDYYTRPRAYGHKGARS
ncbi:electron transport complex subunit RsxD [Alloalcanivorax profundimaris]|uniref:electron transport complex subunit RsxD n=1 Tax=Alloalcanivorax profundimaris TaxID=2735259 RepID=UPI000C3C66BA|nr:electron transport complex subunit RsxD [Alloalcanivorax profundimaris]MAO58488.1 electron transport complex subunit RsxD [Alcanivorax sp.]MAY10472.1 electron transport complex subunit RsxD [Alcanivorax sp.]MBF1800151.1 electron transport complex subunit RsxD [Alloalcanivorax profundimaris]MBI53316.1 electron transport complex subunit RsxD [Alcanivorax sp.]HCE41267.1 electron transport complex subunit RsxD [Alcanivorax sp.]|tara:strand:- start:41296 stop:42303 length:1008 start_codon:yes stop_codon:yes gene_type:complete